MTVEEIKETTSMRDVLARYGVQVNRNGMCCCPIHDERHPSMKVYKDGYKCFACGSGGDIFKFVQEYEHCDFKTAFMILGGTYEKHKNETVRINSRVRFDRKKAKRQREEREAKKFRRLFSDSIKMCEWWIKNREPYSDDWCYAHNMLYILQEEYEEKYVYEKEVDEVNVYRKCREIEQRFTTL